MCKLNTETVDLQRFAQVPTKQRKNTAEIWQIKFILELSKDENLADEFAKQML